MQRNYVINKEDIEIRVDFGKKNSKDYTTLVISEIKDNKVNVISATTLGRACKWDKESINSCLLKLYGLEDKE